LSSITGSGTVIFNGSGTIAGGSAVEVNNIELNGLTTLSTGLTINSNLTLKSGSSLSATPIYGSSSSLTYFTGGSYSVNLEWTGNNTVAGLGVPNDVQISNNTTINMPSSDRGISGSYTSMVIGQGMDSTEYLMPTTRPCFLIVRAHNNYV
jgi:hypothetical protein